MPINSNNRNLPPDRLGRNLPPGYMSYNQNARSADGPFRYGYMLTSEYEGSAHHDPIIFYHFRHRAEAMEFQVHFEDIKRESNAINALNNPHEQLRRWRGWLRQCAYFSRIWGMHRVPPDIQYAVVDVERNLRELGEYSGGGAA
jgi:hypothetical protein